MSLRRLKLSIYEVVIPREEEGLLEADKKIYNHRLSQFICLSPLFTNIKGLLKPQLLLSYLCLHGAPSPTPTPQEFWEYGYKLEKKMQAINHEFRLKSIITACTISNTCASKHVPYNVKI
jgi:hypothetical protein